MKLKGLIILFTLALVFSGCKRQDTDSHGNTQIELGAVKDAVLTRALTESPLAQGYRFRLYILRSGDTNIANMIATRTYTISDNIGTPELDAGQSEIKIAQDDYDFYVVGPLNGVDDKGTPVEIATETGVNAYAGNDIISSVTTQTVSTGENIVTPTTLKHLMARMQVVIERPANTTAYANLRVDELLLFDQPVTGTFAFGADGGSVTPAAQTFTRSYIPPAKESEDRYVATDYLFAQPQKSIKIETTFDARVSSEGTVEDKTYYGQSGSVDSDIVAGNAYEIKANPLVPTELLWRLKLVPWYDQNQGSTSSEHLQLICSFSGLDAPMELNGKKYWKDRSGNEYHGEIMGSVAYNALGKYYTATSDLGSFIQLPALGDMKDITVELVLASEYNGRTTPFHAKGKDGKPSAKMHVPNAEADLYLDWGEPVVTTDRIGPFPHRLNDYGFYQAMSTWQYTRRVNASDVSSTIYHDGTQLTTETKRSRTLDFEDVKFLNGGNAVTKLYAVRIYRRVLTTTELANNAKNDKAVYAEISTDDTGKYIQKGLILDLQGATAPVLLSDIKRTVWKDASSHQNHASLLNTVGVTHDSFKKGYKFSGTGTNNIMQLLRGLGDLSGCTIEVVMTSGKNKQADNINFMDRDNNNIYTFSSPNNNFIASFPGSVFKIQDATTYSADLAHTWSTVRDPFARTVSLYQNGYAQVTSDALKLNSVSIPNQSLKLAPITIAQLGGKLGGSLAFNGIIHAVRVYDRPLSDTERYANYEVDKTKYNIPASSQYLPPVVDGLVFCYDGRHAPKTVGTKKYWVDEVAKNDAEIIGNVPHDPSDGSYTFTFNNMKNYMKMVYTVKMNNNFTAEFVLKSDGPHPGTPVYWATHSNLGDTQYRILSFHLPYDRDGKYGTIFIDAPGVDRYQFGWPTGVGGYTDARKVVIRRDYAKNKSEFFMYNRVVGSGSAATNIANSQCVRMQFGGNDWGGKFYSIRLYDRVLTDAEITENYNYDKAAFKFKDN